MILKFLKELKLSFLIFICLLLTSMNIFSQEFAGEIGDKKGIVKVLKAGDEIWYPVIEGQPIQPNDRIKTYENSYCEIELDDGSFILVAENTESTLDFLEFSKEKYNSKITLWFGKLLLNIKKKENTKMNIHTPTTVLAVRGTEFAVESSTFSTNVGVFTGELSVSNPEMTNQEIILKKDQETTIEEGSYPQAPVGLQAVMMEHKKRLQDLRERIQLMRERLKRMPPEKRILARKRIFERFQNIKDKRKDQRKKIKDKIRRYKRK